ncbi:hypothetical protein [Dendrosporobacter sp. 1207_IL3150]|uniref:hypothetical protein n=1 Tax=Dendrosporobacter sp. 1207_IL3150 TaxID=3084054 RepID=UPI002FD8B9C9
MIKFPDRAVWFSFAIHTILVSISYLLSVKLPVNNVQLPFINDELTTLTPIMDALIRWDAHWYTFIAQNGYDMRSIVFFPLLIYMVKIPTYLGFSYAASGLIVCNLFAFLSFWIMHTTLKLDFNEREVNFALISYAVIPTSFFLNSIYTEPIFLFFSLLCVYFSRTEQWWFAGISGALATLTRNIGVCLFLLLIYEFYRKNPYNRNSFFKILPLSFPPIALICFSAYNFVLVGDPLAFVHSQQEWGRRFGVPWENFVRNLPHTFSPDLYIQPGATLDTFMVTLCFIALCYLTIFQKTISVPTCYLIIGWLWFLIPLTSTAPWLPLYSMSRFALVIFPIYIFIGKLPKSLFYLFITISAVIMTLCTALFFNWFWVG